ncbi:hypothetical protein GGF31_004655 [Allomyces arbusculus]|nr:hypothetical protein GGF31_004655 [Allomyces arbusculus]
MPRPRPARRALVAAALLLALTALLLTPALAAPQLNIPGIGTVNLPGSGSKPTATASESPSATATPTATSASSSAAPSSSGTATATATTAKPKPTVADKCPGGRCKVDGRGSQECIWLEKTKACSAFTGLYIPTNISSYFELRLPAKRSYLIPELKNATDLDDQFNAEKSYAFMQKYVGEYMVNIAGCQMPDQRWYKTWFCLDLLDFFSQKGDPCSQNSKFSVCASTLDARAASLQNDISNATSCPVGQSGRDAAAKHITFLNTTSYRGTDTSCISGEDNENNASVNQLCGYFSEAAACSHDCKSLNDAVRGKCPQYLADAKAQSTQAASSSACDPNDKSCEPGSSKTIPIIIGSVVGVLVLGALVVLWRIRKRNADNAAKAATMARTENVPPPAPAPASIAPPAPVVAPAPQPFNPQPVAYPAQPQLPQPAVATSAEYQQPLMGGVGGPAAAAAAAAAGAGAYAASQQSPTSPVPNVIPMPPPAGGEAETERTVTVVKLAFAPSSEDELALSPGDLVTIHNRYSDGWARGSRHPRIGENAPTTGYFPLMVTENVEPRTPPTRFESLSRRN